ncbi:MAG: hypothetical protein JEZ07_19985 [Phycisphaerae bacterium]|nr:hypothetical protein [Phycisphaerae bacterium]
MNMHAIDWSIVIGLIVVLTFGALSTMRHTKSVAGFLAAERCGRRYILSVANGSAQVGVITFMVWIQIYYDTGFCAIWWSLIQEPVLIVLAISGWVYYRYRQTRAMTLAQFFEMRYSKNFRIFAGLLAFCSGVMNFGIFPSVGSRFFIALCDLPSTFSIFGYVVSMYVFVMLLLLIISLVFTFLGGQIAIMVTDFIQGTFSNIVLAIVVIYFLFKFSWGQISDTLLLSEVGRSAVNPFDLSREQNFGPIYYVVAFVTIAYSTMALQGTAGYNCSALNAHETKMANILNGWRWRVLMLLPLVAPLCVRAYVQHADYYKESTVVYSKLDKVRAERMFELEEENDSEARKLLALANETDDSVQAGKLRESAIKLAIRAETFKDLAGKSACELKIMQNHAKFVKAKSSDLQEGKVEYLQEIYSFERDEAQRRSVEYLQMADIMDSLRVSSDAKGQRLTELVSEYEDKAKMLKDKQFEYIKMYQADKDEAVKLQLAKDDEGYAKANRDSNYHLELSQNYKSQYNELNMLSKFFANELECINGQGDLDISDADDKKLIEDFYVLKARDYRQWADNYAQQGKELAGIIAITNDSEELKVKTEQFKKDDVVCTEMSDMVRQAEEIENRMRVPIVLGRILPLGLLGLFCAAMLAAFVSTHDTYLHSWGSIMIQDVVMPFRKKPLAPKPHMWLLRISIFMVAVIIFMFSLFFENSQRITMFLNITITIFIGGAGSVIIGGLYWKRGTTMGAWFAMFFGMTAAGLGTFVTQKGPDYVNQLIARDIGFFNSMANWFDGMNLDFWATMRYVFSINGQNWTFWVYVGSISCYIIVSLLTCRKPFNMEKLLHKGQYAVDGEDTVEVKKDTLLEKLGWNSEFNRKDKIVAGISLLWPAIWFVVFLVGSIIYYLSDKNPATIDLVWLKFWHIWLWLVLIASVVITIWFTIGGFSDIRFMYRKLNSLKSDEADDGHVNK